MEVIIIGIATAFNFIVLNIKFKKERYSDLFLDVLALISLNWMFGGTMSGMTVAMVASAIISVYLYFNPQSFMEDDDATKSP